MAGQGAIISRIRGQRESAGLSQEALAQAVGVSRQALGAIEAGRTVPSTALALRLARALDCSVDTLFALPDDTPLQARLAPPDGGDGSDDEGSQRAAGRRVAVGRVGGHWVAHALGDKTACAADGLLAPRTTARRLSTTARAVVEPIAGRASFEHNVLIAGCAPLLETLAQHSARFRDARATWLPANSTRALDLLAEGLVHVAGVHHRGDTREGNLAAVQARLRGRPMHVVNLTRWRQGLVLAAGNPLGIREPTDLLHRGLRFAHRELGAAAQALVQERLGGSAPGGPRASGHGEVAALVRAGAADAGVAIESVAIAAGLAFVPLSEERFDLVLPAELTAHPPVARLLALLTERAFLADAGALPGYDLALCGDATELAAGDTP